MTRETETELKTLHPDGAAEKLLPIIRPVQDKTKTNSKENAIQFSEALEQTGFGKFNYFLMFVSGIVLANVLLETAAIGFILPVAQCDLQLSNQDKGVLSAIGFVGMIASSHLWGFLADTKGRRRVIRPTLIAAFVVTLLSSFSKTFWMMTILRFLNGFFVSGGSATIYAYLGEFHTDKTRSRAMMGSSFIFALGAMILPVLAFLVINQDWVLPLPFLGIDYKPWRFFFIVCGIPGFLCGISLYFLPESPKFLLLIDREAKAIDVFHKMARWNSVKEELKIEHIENEVDEDSSSPFHSSNQDNSNGGSSNIIIAFLHTMWKQTVPLFHKKYLRTTLIVCTLQFWLYVVTNGMYMWFPHIINSMVEFMNEHPGEHIKICQIVYDKHEFLYKTDGTMECVTKLEDTTFYYSLVMEILYASSFAVIGLVINRVGKIPILIFAMAFCTACGLAGVFVTDPSIAAYLYVLLFLVGAAINVLGAATVELYPTNLRGMAICISLMVGRLGSVVGANIVGALLGSHCELTFYIPCGFMFFCAFLSLFIPRKSMDEVAKEKAVEA